MALDFLVIYGSVRHDRQGIKAARFILEACHAGGDTCATLIDPAEDRLPLLDRMYKEYQGAGRPPRFSNVSASQLRQADGFIVVSGEYNHSIPPALSNLLDHFLEEHFGALRQSFATRPAPLAGSGQPCNCEPCSASWELRASRRFC